MVLTTIFTGRQYWSTWPHPCSSYLEKRLIQNTALKCTVLDIDTIWYYHEWRRVVIVWFSLTGVATGDRSVNMTFMFQGCGQNECGLGMFDWLCTQTYTTTIHLIYFSRLLPEWAVKTDCCCQKNNCGLLSGMLTSAFRLRRKIFQWHLSDTKKIPPFSNIVNFKFISILLGGPWGCSAGRGPWRP